MTAPKIGILLRAHDQLEAVRVRDHLLHGHADDVGVGTLFLRAAGDLLEGLPNPLVGADVQHNAADVGLVRDLRRMDLQHDRIAEVMGDFDRLVGRASRLRLRHRNLIRLQERLRDVFRENLAAFGENRVENAPQPLAIERELQRQVFRGFVQDFEVAGVGNQVHERADRLFGRVVGRDSGVVEYLDALGHHAAAHPSGQHGLVGMAGRLAHRLPPWPSDRSSPAE